MQSPPTVNFAEFSSHNSDDDVDVLLLFWHIFICSDCRTMVEAFPCVQQNQVFPGFSLYLDPHGLS